MRILWHSAAPWMKTGYGQQTALFAPALAAAGHEVTLSAFAGLQGRQLEWEGLTVLPGSREAHGNDFLAVRAAEWLAAGPGLILILCDTWCINPAVIRGGPVAMWTPVDCSPVSALDKGVLGGSGALPIAVSRFGQKMLTEAGFPGVPCVPHGIDTAVFTPRDRAECRQALGFPQSAFIIGMNGANDGAGPSRKAFPEHLQAFAQFRKTHKDAMMALHTRMDGPNAVHMYELAEQLGVLESLLVTDQRHYWQGSLGADYIATFSAAVDVMAQASRGEGFGLPALEAQACGTPVILNSHSAMTELCGAGWLVTGQPEWQNDHLAWWSAPRVDHLRRAYGKAYTGAAAPGLAAAAREFALGYGVARVTGDYWAPVLAGLAATLGLAPAGPAEVSTCD